jgi:hypothetical protein
MALNLYQLDLDNSYYQVDNGAKKITAYHDASDGSYEFSRFYLKNEPSSSGYENITITISVDGQTEIPLSNNGIIYQLLSLPSAEAEIDNDAWEHLPLTNELSLAAIEAGIESYRYFVLRTYVPRGHGANYITEASLKVSVVEVV